MTWNHRLIRDTKDGETWYGIHEVFYEDDGEPNGCTVEAVSVVGETVDECKEILEWMIAACSKPVIEMQYFRDLEEKHAKEPWPEDPCPKNCPGRGPDADTCIDCIVNKEDGDPIPVLPELVPPAKPCPR